VLAHALGGARVEPAPDAFNRVTVGRGPGRPPRPALAALEPRAGVDAALDLDYEQTSGSFTHHLRTAVVDPQGRLAHLFRGNEWKPEGLVAELRNTLP
jgi:hypothetical protein